jgi:hypothetical protein
MVSWSLDVVSRSLNAVYWSLDADAWSLEAVSWSLDAGLRYSCTYTNSCRPSFFKAFEGNYLFKWHEYTEKEELRGQGTGVPLKFRISFAQYML